jgi:hypothetical protein
VNWWCTSFSARATINKLQTLRGSQTNTFFKRKNIIIVAMKNINVTLANL